MPKIAKAAKKLKKLRYHRYAVRIGRQPGIYATYHGEAGAEPQVNGYPGCHMGFTKAQCERALHHMYIQMVLDDSQVSKLAAGQLLADPHCIRPGGPTYLCRCFGAPVCRVFPDHLILYHLPLKHHFHLNTIST